MKMAAEVRWLALFTIYLALSFTNGDPIHRRFEYKYSFKPPFLAQKDGTVPFWEYGGNAIASSDSVRITPSLRSQKGALWIKKPTYFDWWEVEIIFRITGRGRIGADGLAFWYTTAKGAYDGTVFGSSDRWNGLGLIFDSFDNDNKHNNPYIMAVLNDGMKEFDHMSDGTTQALTGCARDFRNKPFPTRAKIEYYRNTLTLFFHNGMTNNDQDYELCFRAENVNLPMGGYFGLSAATGGLADDHDVVSFLTTSLHPLTTADGHVSVEDAKITMEYQEYQRKLDQQKEDYKKEHPDQAHDKDDMEEWFESDNQRELRQIFAGQTQVFEVLRELNRKLDEVIGKQERSLSLITQLPAGGIQTAGGQPGQAMLIDTIRRQEVDAVLTNQKNLLSTTSEIMNFMDVLRSKSDTIINNQARAPTAQVQPIGYDYQTFVSEMRDSLNTLKREISQANAKMGGASQGAQVGDCPTANCLTTTMFLVFLAIQMFVIIGYNIFKDNREAQAKKFY